MRASSAFSSLRRLAFEYGPAGVGASLWAMAKFPDRLEWARGLYGRSFGYLAFVYDRWTEVEGYGEALGQALTALAGIPESILDVATGTGFVARKLKMVYPSAAVTGVDISPEMVGIARHAAVAEGLDVEFRVADAASLPFGSNRFDVVVLQNSIPYPEEMMRVLTSGGSAVFVVSFAGPWVAAAWPAIAGRFLDAGAVSAEGRRAGPGFFGIAVRG